MRTHHARYWGGGTTTNLALSTPVSGRESAVTLPAAPRRWDLTVCSTQTTRNMVFDDTTRILAVSWVLFEGFTKKGLHDASPAIE